jgi:transcriptional regulator with XRE-family HTH domain
MASDRTVNDHVRHRLRELRNKRRIGIREIAAGTGIASSSYCCMEGGHYNISLDHLFRILGVLEADISDVWPSETTLPEAASSVQLRRIQEFRISEIVSLASAEGAALFSLSGGKCEVLLYQGLSDFLLDRLCLYLEDGRVHEDGFWLQKQLGEKRFLFFLKGQTCPEYLRKLLEQYLVIWSNLFSHLLKERCL